MSSKNRYEIRQLVELLHLQNLLPLLGCHEIEGSSRGSSKKECDLSVCNTELTQGTDPISDIAIIQKSAKLI